MKQTDKKYKKHKLSPDPFFVVPLAEVGYLPDGTPMNRAGNCVNHPETIGPDPHAPGLGMLFLFATTFEI